MNHWLKFMGVFWSESGSVGGGDLTHSWTQQGCEVFHVLPGERNSNPSPVLKLGAFRTNVPGCAQKQHPGLVLRKRTSSGRAKATKRYGRRDISATIPALLRLAFYSDRLLHWYRFSRRLITCLCFSCWKRRVFVSGRGRKRKGSNSQSWGRLSRSPVKRMKWHHITGSYICLLCECKLQGSQDMHPYITRIT